MTDSGLKRSASANARSARLRQRAPHLFGRCAITRSSTIDFVVSATVIDPSLQKFFEAVEAPPQKTP